MAFPRSDDRSASRGQAWPTMRRTLRGSLFRVVAFLLVVTMMLPDPGNAQFYSFCGLDSSKFKDAVTIYSASSWTNFVANYKVKTGYESDGDNANAPCDTVYGAVTITAWSNNNTSPVVLTFPSHIRAFQNAFKVISGTKYKMVVNLPETLYIGRPSTFGSGTSANLEITVRSIRSDEQPRGAAVEDKRGRGKRTRW